MSQVPATTIQVNGRERVHPIPNFMLKNKVWLAYLGT